MKVFIAILLISHLSFAQAKKLYEYRAKKDVAFSKLLKSGIKKVLLIDEKCIVCEALLDVNFITNSKKVIIGVINRPSFRWMAKLSRKYPDLKIYDLNDLGLKVSDGTPQLYTFDELGKVVGRVYGKTKILKEFI